MAHLDVSPLFRTLIGADRLAQLLDDARAASPAPTYPPYNVERIGEESYRISIAVAGFRGEDLSVVAEGGRLTVSGQRPKQEDSPMPIYRGIAARAFTRRFDLTDHLVVESAHLELGILHVELRRIVPEAMKPRRIEIRTA